MSIIDFDVDMLDYMYKLENDDLIEELKNRELSIPQKEELSKKIGRHIPSILSCNTLADEMKAQFLTEISKKYTLKVEKILNL